MHKLAHKTIRRLRSILGMVIVLTLVLQTSSTTIFAQVAECDAPNTISCTDYNAILSEREWYAQDQINALSSCSSSGDTSWGITLQGKDNQDKAFNYFIQRGLSIDQAAAILGNLLQESGVNPLSQQSNGPGMGIAQWSRGDRWDSNSRGNVIDFAAGKFVKGVSGSPWDLSIQLNFIWYELTLGGFQGAFANFKKETTLAGMVDVFVRQYEIAGIIGPRLTLAEQAKAAYIKLHGTPSSGSSPTGGCTGLGVSGNFTFPELTTQAAITGHSPTWCYKSQTSCHHDYRAADIFNDEGTTNVAAVGGKVIRAVDMTSCPGSNLYDVPRVQIEGSDGKYYYYTHMKPGSIQVHDNQVIQAGQPLGQIGPTACAEYTPTHLHFQVSSVPITNTSDPVERTKYIDPQPNLVAAFNKLPTR